MEKRTIIWEENTEPPKNYFWVKPDNKVYEFNHEFEEWVESETISFTPSTRDSKGYSTNEPSESTTDAIQAYVDKQEAAGKTVSPTATITVDYIEGEVPETITLPETTHPMTLKGDFSQNENTMIESAGEVSKVTVNNTGAESNVTIDLPSSTVTLSGKYDTVNVKAVSNNTLNITTSCKIKKFILWKGTAIVNNAFIEDNIEEYEVKRGTLKANDQVEATTSSSFVSKPRVVNVTKETNVRNIAFGIIASGHYVFNNESKVNMDYTGGGVMARGSVKLDFTGTGEWHSTTNPTIWAAAKDVVIRIEDGKFFNDGNSNETIYAEQGTIEIYGGEFHNVKEEGKKDFLLNCKDANYQAGTAKIIVYGGKFYGFDPAANAAESADMSTNFVAEGYHSEDRGEYFEVVKD